MGDDLIPLNKAGAQHLAQLAGLSLVGTADPEATMDLIIPSDDPVVVEMVRRSIAQGGIGNAELAAYGRRCGVTGRTMRTRLNATVEAMRSGDDGGGDTWQLTAEMLEIIASHNGRVAPAHADMARRGMKLPSPTTMWRRWNDLDKAFRDFIISGRVGMLASWAYVPYTAPYRNAVWQGDFVPLPLDVIPEGYETTQVMPWVLIFEDDHSRAATCWSMECRPNRHGSAALTVATLAAGYEGVDIEGVFLGGVPEILRVDNDKAFLSKQMDALSATVGNEVHAVPPHTPFMKGKVERLGKTLQDSVVALMEGYTHGPLTYSGRNPFRDGGAITEATLRRFLTDWFHAYNVTRVHSRVEYGTPLRQWASSDRPVRRVDPAALRPFLLPLDREYKAQKDGVWWDGGYWTGPGILQVTGRMVTLRRPVGLNPDHIEIFHDDKWVLTAWRAENITAEQRKVIQAERSRLYTDALDVVEGAAARRGDANAIAAENGGPISPAGAPGADVFAADSDALWDILGDDAPGPPDPAATPASSRRPARRTKRRPITSRRRSDRPDDGPASELWGLFDEVDADGDRGPDEAGERSGAEGDSDGDPEVPS